MTAQGGSATIGPVSATHVDAAALPRALIRALRSSAETEKETHEPTPLSSVLERALSDPRRSVWWRRHFHRVQRGMGTPGPGMMPPPGMQPPSMPPGRREEPPAAPALRQVERRCAPGHASTRRDAADAPTGRQPAAGRPTFASLSPGWSRRQPGLAGRGPARSARARAEVGAGRGRPGDLHQAGRGRQGRSPRPCGTRR